MIRKTSIHKDHFKTVKKAIKKQGNYMEEVQKIGIKNFYYQRLRERTSRFQRWRRWHRRNRELVNVGMMGNTKMFIEVFWWEIEETQVSLNKMKSDGIEKKRAKKLPSRMTDVLISKATQKRKKAGEPKRLNPRTRHLKLC
ncbi:hypothetical protein IM40_01060 [Candidatus Paracaedimonas acanthamoebae]|nr:hypothetical protein IM40_01060 [Candidatus Paracaedimonas acanthamoebae]